MQPSKLFIILYMQYKDSRIYFYNLKFGIFDAMVLRACLLCSTHW